MCKKSNPFSLIWIGLGLGYVFFSRDIFLNIRFFSIFEMASEVMNVTIFLQLIFGALYISATNFVLDSVSLISFVDNFIRAMPYIFCQVLKSLNFTFIIVLMNFSLSTCCIFMLCHVGSMTTKTFLRFADIPYESMWYKFPLDLRKYLPLIIGEAQRPRVFHGIRMIDLNLTMFAKVCVSILLDICHFHEL